MVRFVEFRTLVHGAMVLTAFLGAQASIVAQIPTSPVTALPTQDPFESSEPGFTGQRTNPASPITISVISPQNEEVVTGNTVDVFFAADNYQLAPGGNRLHVIIDNDSPIIHDNLKKPLILRRLTEGGHTLRVFAVKPNGLFINEPGAFAMTYFFVRKKSTFQNFAALDQPMLTVNQPFNGVTTLLEDGKVWFDFRTENAPLQAEGAYAVKYRINNAESVVTDNKPIFWPGLKPGRYEFVAELVDREGQPITGVFNRVKRSFDVRIAPRALPVAPANNGQGNYPPPP
jgi:hypothetical protein